MNETSFSAFGHTLSFALQFLLHSRKTLEFTSAKMPVTSRRTRSLSLFWTRASSVPGESGVWTPLLWSILARRARVNTAGEGFLLAVSAVVTLTAKVNSGVLDRDGNVWRSF